MCVVRKVISTMLHGWYGRRRNKPQAYNAYCNVYDKHHTIAIEYATLVAEAEIGSDPKKVETNLRFRHRRLKEMMEAESDQKEMERRISEYTQKYTNENDIANDELLFPEEQDLDNSDKQSRIAMRRRQR